MDSFSEAFSAARKALDSGDLDGKFSKLQKGLKSFVSGPGPELSEKHRLSELRTVIRSAVLEQTAAGKADTQMSAKILIGGAGSGVGKVDRAATLKALRHFYHQKSAGGQQIWVYAPPLAYTKWIFDEVAGKSEVELRTVLAKEDPEVYSDSQRDVMAQAVQHARAWSLDVVTKLDSADDATKSVVKRYFGKSGTSESDLKATMKTLAGGYKRIAAGCNDGSIVISDEPIDRNSGGWKDWAFIYTAESMSVIYLQGAWLKKAGEITPSNQTPLHRCTRTIIHELSHKQVKTEDIVYGPKGLKPEGSTALSPEHALHNADSWAYFAADVLGRLSGPDKSNGDTPCSEILKTPTRTLVTA